MIYFYEGYQSAAQNIGKGDYRVVNLGQTELTILVDGEVQTLRERQIAMVSAKKSFYVEDTGFVRVQRINGCISEMGQTVYVAMASPGAGSAMSAYEIGMGLERLIGGFSILTTSANAGTRRFGLVVRIMGTSERLYEVMVDVPPSTVLRVYLVSSGMVLSGVGTSSIVLCVPCPEIQHQCEQEILWHIENIQAGDVIGDSYLSLVRE